jgi:hypothetical protein
LIENEKENRKIKNPGVIPSFSIKIVVYFFVTSSLFPLI